MSLSVLKGQWSDEDEKCRVNVLSWISSQIYQARFPQTSSHPWKQGKGNFQQQSEEMDVSMMLWRVKQTGTTTGDAGKGEQGEHPSPPWAWLCSRWAQVPSSVPCSRSLLRPALPYSWKCPRRHPAISHQLLSNLSCQLPKSYLI